MRVSMRSGRIGSAKHNDRSFDLSHAAHVDQTRTNLNQVWLNQSFITIMGDVTDLQESAFKTLEEYELDFYQLYQQQCDITNANYIRQGHPERCKTPEDLYHGKLTRPEELILQIGDMHDNIPQDVFMSCVEEYIEQFNEWNDEHGEHGQILDVSYHFDEQSPHAHIRRVWDYVDKNGVYRLGQNKALEQAGIELPNPLQKPSRYNNRKMTFDAMMRGKWQEICKNHGFEIETEPRPNRKHKKKAEYIADCLNKEIETLQKNVDFLKDKFLSLDKDVSHKSAELYDITEKLKSVEYSVLNEEALLDSVKTQLNATRGDYEALKRSYEAQINELEQEASVLTAMTEKMVADRKGMVLVPEKLLWELTENISLKDLSVELEKLLKEEETVKKVKRRRQQNINLHR